MMKYASIFLLGCIMIWSVGCDSGGGGGGGFGGSDLVSLHYDHAPDRDDGQSAAADRTMLEDIYGRGWIPGHVLAVSGATGRNDSKFNGASGSVMNACWGDIGWVAANGGNRPAAVEAVTARWLSVLQGGGDIWVKEGGQSDLTAAVVQQIQARNPNINTRARVHVVQHGQWNEDNTTPSALAYVQAETDYIRIANANAYLNKAGGDAAFQSAAVNHPVYGPYWQAAFNYYPPSIRLDFSDTGELMHILGLGQVGIDEYRQRFLE